VSEATREQRIAGLRGRVGREAGVDPTRVEVALAPYRICPLGAHSDHQQGRVLGAAIDACTLLAFASRPETALELDSADFPGRVRVELADASSYSGPEWGRYALGASAVLRERLAPRPIGLSGRIEGTLPGAGLASSASVLIAILQALARVNGLALAPEELARLARRAENEYVGVACGVLDPASVAGARRDHLLAIDTVSVSWEAIPLGESAAPAQFLVVYTGMPRHLASMDFNLRVEECLVAARQLGALAGLPDVQVLGDVSAEVFEAHAAELPPTGRRRARHFFSEQRRVREGIAAWLAGDLRRFGALMNASCESSIANYQTGSRELVRLQEILLATPGVLGSRFSGAGFGGCAVALVAQDACQAVQDQVLCELRAAFPTLSARARCFLTRSEDGARIL
jgi:galactokinase/galacturonokinase